MDELVLRVNEALVEPVSDALADELDALSVSVEDADADSDAEHALFGEPGMPAPLGGWHRSVLRALFPDEAAATAAATLLLAQDWAHDLHLQSIKPVEDQDWVRLTQSQFTPVAITPDFWIVLFGGGTRWYRQSRRRGPRRHPDRPDRSIRRGLYG